MEEKGWGERCELVLVKGGEHLFDVLPTGEKGGELEREVGAFKRRCWAFMERWMGGD